MCHKNNANRYLGNAISSDVSGSVTALAHLSGVPDLLLTFNDPHVIDDCSFHPCVRYSRYENESVISFVPPDGNFQLMRYRVKPSALKSGFSPPIVCTPQLSYGNPDKNSKSFTGRIVLNVVARSISSLIHSSNKGMSVTIEDVSITIPFPKVVKTANLSVNIGQVIYDEAGKVAKWVIGNIDEKKRPHLTGTMVVDGNKRPEENPPLSVTWKIPLASWSGLAVSGLSITGESYRPYKGFRNIARSGRFQVRCN